MRETTVVHWKDRPADGDYVYIGRPSPFGNPFRVRAKVQRKLAILLYRRYFLERMHDPEFRAQVYALCGKVLVCHCAPLACHGDVIAEWLNGSGTCHGDA